ncbi:glycosyltransferase [Roseomonas sp. 18066]|uniref:glycosyltransferase n=1 Tax=Roseomonas sp. 18066 TaxID=2681412 RepID=UPI00135A3598|nr:glycosyltransferase [Roseomonas sp. 18066]
MSAICVIAHSHPDVSKGGGEVAAYRQVQTLRSAGQRAILVAASAVNTGYAARQPIDRVTPYADDEFLYDFGGMEPDRLWWSDPFKRDALVRFLAALPVTAYHFHHYWRVGIDLIAALMEARPDARFAITLHEMLAICVNHGQMIRTQGRELCDRESPLRCLGCFPEKTIPGLVLRKAALLAVLRRFHHRFYPSAFIRGRYEAWGLAGTAGSVLENYLGDALLAAPRRPPPAPGMAQRFGFFGQPTPFKGLDILVRGFSLALKEIPTATLTVFGAERADMLRDFPDFRTLLDETGKSISFAGRYDPSEVVALMGSVGWVVIPSIWWENSPVVIQEARRTGTPLIASDIGGMAEKVLDGVDGLHFRRASATDLARVLAEAARPETHARLSGSVRDVIDRHDFLHALDAVFGAGHPIAS